MSAECSAGNIPLGYKQTEVGVIPEDWSSICYADYLNIISGLGFKKAEYCDVGIRLLRIDNVSYGQISWDSIVYLPLQYTEKFPNLVLSEGDILLALNRPITNNQLKLARLSAEDSPAILYQRVGKIEVINSKLDKKFAYFVLRKFVRKFVEESSVGSDQPFVSTTALKKIHIPLPPTKAEQEAIAEALSDADALIESLEQLIAKKRQIKQGAMQELLTGKRRLPGFSGEWIDCSLRDCLLANPDYGINAPGVPDSGNLPTYLRITDIDDDGRFMQGSQVAVNHPLSMNYLLGRNEIVFARTGASVGKTYLYNIKDGELVFAGFLIRARINCEKLCPEFFATFTKTSKYWNWVRMMSMRSGQPGINGNEFASLDLYLPPTLEEQISIATILSDMDSEITALEEKLAKARQIKQGMMQELLTGRVRLV